MHLLLGEIGLPPAEIADHFGPMGKRLPRSRACTMPGFGTGFQGAQFTGPGCCSMIQNRPLPTPR